MEREGYERIRWLRSQIASVMESIRATTPRTWVSPDKAKASEVWEGYFEGQAIERVIIYLRSSGCWWAMHTRDGSTKFKAGCLDCEHSVAETTFGSPISAKSYIQQFNGEYGRYDFSKYPMLAVYNEGNFFNPRELPTEARKEILRIIGADRHIKAVVLECLPEFISEDVLQETKEILGDKHVEIGIGLESADPTVRTLCVNKSFTLEKFEQTAHLVNRYFNLLAYVLVKPSFLTEREALEDSLRTVRYAYNAGARVVSIEPISIGEFAMSGALSKLGLYRPAWLWSVREVAREALKLGEVRIGGYQFAPSYERHARNCDACTMNAKEAICHFNGTNQFRAFEDLDCICKAEWMAELQAERPPLCDRIEYAIDRLKAVYDPSPAKSSLVMFTGR